MENPALPPDVNRGPEILAICGSLVVLALLFVLLRVWVRVKITQCMGRDDYTMVAAMTVMFIEFIIIIVEVQYGAGRHHQYIKPEKNIVTGLHLNFVTQPLCLIGLCLTKISVGFFLLRLSASQGFHRIIWGVLIFTALSFVGNFRVSVLTDLLFALLPILILWNVRLNWKVKTAVAGILSLGILISATAAAIVKITYISNYGKHGDFLFDSSDLTIWTTVEICVAIIAACIPCLKPLFKAVLHGSSIRSHKYSNNGYISSQKRSQPNSDGERGIEMYRSTMPGRNGVTSYPSKSGSEESIIARPMSNSDGIMRTLEVSIVVAKEEQERELHSPF
ncbi:integral membrane protein family [Fusarium sp. NRRL 52700]|nr:integral membrane protein family [Fusarium sp. NRRL 52700]